MTAGELQAETPADMVVGVVVDDHAVKKIQVGFAY
jgi:hypothetical protein